MSHRTQLAVRAALALLLAAAGAAALQLADKPARTFERPEGDVLSVAFSADGKFLCAGGDRGVVYTWDAITGEVINWTKAHLRAAVFAVVTHPLAPFAVHASELGIKFSLLGEHDRVPSFPAEEKRQNGFKPRQTVLTLDFSKDGNHLASGDRGGETIVWELPSGNAYRRFQPGKQPVNGVRFHPDGNRLAVASDDGKLRLFDTKADKMLYEIAAHEGACNAVAFSPDGKWLATAGKDKKIKLWNSADGGRVAVLEGHEDAANVVLFQPKAGGWLASGADDKTVRLWDVGKKKLAQTIAYDKPVYALAWRPDGKVLATGSGKLVQLFDVK